jgi:hypothetical protein
MSTNNEHRFHELAHKSLAKEIQPAEEAELEALIAENPELKKEFEQLRGEMPAIRELLTLIQDVENPQGDVPAIPMERLKERVEAVFTQRQPSDVNILEALTKLEQWAAALVGNERKKVMELIEGIRTWVSGMTEESYSVARLGFVDLGLSLQAKSRRGREAGEDAKQLLAEFTDRLQSLEKQKAGMEAALCSLERQKAELEARLRSYQEWERNLLRLQDRIRQAEGNISDCGKVLQSLLEAWPRKL